MRQLPCWSFLFCFFAKRHFRDLMHYLFFHFYTNSTLFKKQHYTKTMQFIKFIFVCVKNSLSGNVFFLQIFLLSK